MKSPFNREINKYAVVGRDNNILNHVHTSADTEILAAGHYHKGLHVFVEVFGGGFIMQYIDGKLTSSAFGHIIAFETPMEAAIRLTKDAIGAKIPREDFVRIAQVAPSKETEGEIIEFFTCLIDPKKEITRANIGVESMITCNLGVIVDDVHVDSDSYTQIFKLLLNMYLELHKC